MIYELLPPTDTRVLSSIAPFDIDVFKKEEKIELKEFVDNMFETMTKYGGIGLSSNQVGKPYRMFVMGSHSAIHKGKKWACINPTIVSASKQTTRLKEGCLTYPFLFLSIVRPRKCVVKYTDENGDLKEGQLDGMISRIFQHEYEHMLGRNFTEHASKMKLDMAEKKAKKMWTLVQKRNEKANK